MLDFVLIVGGVAIFDVVHRQVKRGKELVHLTPKEYNLLRVLVQHAGKVVTPGQSLTSVLGPAHTEDATYLRVFIGQLRQKI